MKSFRPVLASLALGALMILPAAASDSPYRVVNGPAEFYYGHISFVEAKTGGGGPLILRGGAGTPEPAVLNAPLGPGDSVRTAAAGRIEIQFDNGTIIRMEADSELGIETILARTLSENNRMSNLALRRGRLYVMYKQYSSKEIFQVVLPQAAVKLRHNTVAMIGINGDMDADIQVKYGKADVLFGPSADALEKRIVGKGLRAIVGAGHPFAYRPIDANSDFETWNQAINDDFLELHKGLSALPKPVRRLSPAIQAFAEKFGNIYGTWVYDDYLGYVWRPNYNDTYPNGSWQPYFHGQWVSSGGQMYWVPGEPWGWVPYHLGVWQWDAKKGWYWIPGSAFAPAWVDWAVLEGNFFAWRPWSIWDWAWNDPYAYRYGWAAFFAGNNWYWRSPWTTFAAGSFWGNWNWWNGPINSWGYWMSLAGQYPMAGWQGYEAPKKRDIGGGTIRRPGAEGITNLPMPAEMASLYKKLMAGLQKGDPRLLESVQKPGQAAMVVDAADIGSSRINEKAVPIKSYFESLARTRSQEALARMRNAPIIDSARALQDAAKALEDDRNARSFGGTDLVWEKSASDGRGLDASIMKMLPAPAPRIRDWNPDVAFLRDRGLTLTYNSRANQVVCPELKMTSAMAENGYRIVPAPGHSRDAGVLSRDEASRSGGIRFSGSEGSSGGTSGYMVSPSGGSASATSSSSTASTASSGSGSSGHIK
jgi:hypothetical protein